jgi:hypothetical protein
MDHYGVRPTDEGVHPHDPDDPTWNESWFYDWTSADGREAGHCRIGWMPAQDRVWVWLVLRRGESWFLVEAPHLRGLDDGALDAPGLTLRRTVHTPLERTQLTVQTTARCTHGPRAGQLVPVSVDLTFDAVGPAHSLGANAVDLADGSEIESNRYEQPVLAAGEVTVDGETLAVTARGERDHSWGPRDWRMHWTFLALNGPDRQLLATFVELDGFMRFGIGYSCVDGRMQHVVGVDFDVALAVDAPAASVAGSVAITAEDGSVTRGTITPLGGTELDLSHVLRPAWRTRYHRAQVRFDAEDGTSIVGWLEFNRFDAGLDAVLEDG